MTRVTRGFPWLPLVVLLAACGSSDDSSVAPRAPTPLPALDVPFEIRDIREGTGAPMRSGYLAAISFVGFAHDPNVPGNRGTELIPSNEGRPVMLRIDSGQVIPGVDRALEGMRVGGVREAVIPPELGFGASGSTRIPGNTTLLLEIELVAGEEASFGWTDLVEGSGAEATPGSELQMVYQGWLYDLLAEDRRGLLFDSNTAADPFEFELGAGEVIRGWDLGVPGMRVGGKRRLVIPHPLAYGADGIGSSIPGYATLLFEVELLAAQGPRP